MYYYKAKYQRESNKSKYPCRKDFRHNINPNFNSYTSTPRDSKMSANAKFWKKQTHKALRRIKDEIPNGNFYHKIVDFWWNVY